MAADKALRLEVVDYKDPDHWRWLLTDASGKFLADHTVALQDVSLVFEVLGEAPTVRPRPIGDRLRMLAVFSLPTDQSPLALRRERYTLKSSIQTLTSTLGLSIELRVLQYGVTRELL